jgi:hypothetical protein
MWEFEKVQSPPPCCIAKLSNQEKQPGADDKALSHGYFGNKRAL